MELEWPRDMVAAFDEITGEAWCRLHAPTDNRPSLVTVLEDDDWRYCVDPCMECGR